MSLAIDSGVFAFVALAIFLAAGLGAYFAFGRLSNFMGQVIAAMMAGRRRFIELKLDSAPWSAGNGREEGKATRKHFGRMVMNSEDKRRGSLEAGGSLKGNFEVPPEKAPELLKLMEKEGSANIALLVAHLEPDTKSAFLALLSSERLGVVLEALASPVTFDQKTLERLRLAIEKRLMESMGGAEEIIRTIREVSPGLKRRIMKTLKTQNPPLYEDVREGILFFEDLSALKEQEVKILLAEVPVEDLSLAMSNGSMTQDFKSKIFGSLSRRASITLDDFLRSAAGAPESQVWEAQDKIAKTARKLIAEGAIRHPLKTGEPGIVEGS